MSSKYYSMSNKNGLKFFHAIFKVIDENNPNIFETYEVYIRKDECISLIHNRNETNRESMHLLMPLTEEQHVQRFLNQIIEPHQITIKELLNL